MAGVVPTGKVGVDRVALLRGSHVHDVYDDPHCEDTRRTFLHARPSPFGLRPLDEAGYRGGVWGPSGRCQPHTRTFGFAIERD